MSEQNERDRFGRRNAQEEPDVEAHRFGRRNADDFTGIGLLKK